jgi:hypothetical protein
MAAGDGGLSTVIIIDTIVFVIVVAVYLLVLRKRSPSIYYPRTKSIPLFSSTFAWMPLIAMAPLADIACHSGLTAAMYLRFVVLAVVYAMVACGMAVALLLPTNLVVASQSIGIALSDLFEVTTAMVLTNGSQLLWLPTLVFVVLHVALMVFLMYYLFLFERQQERFVDMTKASDRPSKLLSLLNQYHPIEPTKTSAAFVRTLQITKRTVKVRYLPPSLTTAAPLLRYAPPPPPTHDNKM